MWCFRTRSTRLNYTFITLKLIIIIYSNIMRRMRALSFLLHSFVECGKCTNLRKPERTSRVLLYILYIVYLYVIGWCDCLYAKWVFFNLIAKWSSSMYVPLPRHNSKFARPTSLYIVLTALSSRLVHYKLSMLQFKWLLHR